VQDDQQQQQHPLTKLATMRRVWVALVDAVVSTITVVVGLYVPDPRAQQLILPLLTVWQAMAVTLITVLTVDDVTNARNDHVERLAAAERRSREPLVPFRGLDPYINTGFPSSPSPEADIDSSSNTAS
jgi:hypothetical protein